MIRGRAQSIAGIAIALAVVSVWVAAVRDPETPFPWLVARSLVIGSIVYGYGEFRNARKKQRPYALIRGVVAAGLLAGAALIWAFAIVMLTPIVSPYADTIRNLAAIALAVAAVAVPALAMWGRTVIEQRRMLALVLATYTIGLLAFGTLSASVPNLTLILVAVPLGLIALLAYPSSASKLAGT
jgi:hypothetical protein